MPTRTRDLTEGAIGPTLLLFALPILGANVLQSLNGSINAFWIGRFLGEAALAAITNANNVLFFLLGAVFGLGMAATILVAQAVGRQDPAGARRVIGTSATFFVGLSLVVALGGLPLSRLLLQWMGTPAAALPHADGYLRVIFLAVPFLYMFTFITAVLRGAGDSRTPFRFLMLVVLLDMVLVPAFVFGAGPLPELGMTGAAVAMVIANAASLALMLYRLRQRRDPLWIARHEWHLFKPDWTLVRTLVVKGVPMGAQMVVVSLAMIAMMTMVNRHGTLTTGAYGAVLQLWNYVQMPAMAIGAACSSMAAQNVGAGLWPRVDATARAGLLVNLMLTGALIVALLPLDCWLLGIFLPEGSPSLEVAREINRIGIWSFLFFGATYVLFGVVRSTGAVVPPLVLLGLALWGVRVPFANGLQPALGVEAIWWSFPASAVAAMVLAMAYYRFGRWRTATMLPPVEEPPIPSEIPAQPPAPVATPAPQPENA
ncbi:MAG: MATE family efflux transporter [Gammaproteobacteria bacterium]|nr:MATE family efflux transporter [Gammaproteobacteria bacterium]